MTVKSWEASRQEGGIHHRLQQRVGEWEGTTKTWFEPDKLADESPWRGTIRAALDGRFVVHEYQGSLQGKPLSGVALLGYHLDRDAYEMAWVDSFHSGTMILFSQGQRSEGPYRVLGSYGGPPPQPVWGWRTEIAQPEPDRLVIVHYNITPEGEEAKAVETAYRRAR